MWLFPKFLISIFFGLFTKFVNIQIYIKFLTSNLIVYRKCNMPDQYYWCQLPIDTDIESIIWIAITMCDYNDHYLLRSLRWFSIVRSTTYWIGFFRNVFYSNDILIILFTRITFIQKRTCNSSEKNNTFLNRRRYIIIYTVHTGCIEFYLQLRWSDIIEKNLIYILLVINNFAFSESFKDQLNRLPKYIIKINRYIVQYAWE